ncbi:MAG: NADH-quinone oxidoreductase subunit L [Chloroflexi bacterium]|nr:NADH-quinone oxidoreductase subunit L [Chloroflexota bacterium]
MGIEWAWLLPAMCAGAFGVVALFGRWLPGRGSYLAIGAIGVGFVLFWPIMADVVRHGSDSFFRTWFDAGDTRVRLGMTVDELTVVMLGLVTAVALAVQVYSIGYMRGDPRFHWYFAAHSLFAAAMLGLVLANNLLVFYVLWELVGLGSYLLIGFWYERRSAAEAAKKAFITTRIGDVALLIGILALFKATGTFELTGQGGIFEQIAAHKVSLTQLNLAAVLMFIGAMGKSAQFPLHVWLPDAMEGPTPVSALIHAATMVAAGVYLVARMTPLYVAASSGVQDLVAAIGLITAFVGASLAMVQNDIKKVLAYSTISQLGLMFVGLGSLGVTAAIFHLLTHGFFKALLFLSAGSVISATHEEQDIRTMGGLWNKVPITWVAFTIGALALAAIYPLSGFFSKDDIMGAVFDHRNGAWFAAGLIVAAMTAAYAARLLIMVFFGKPRSENTEHAHESPAVMTLPLAALVIPAAALGLLALPWGSYDGIGSWLFVAPLTPKGYLFHAKVFWPSLVVALGAFALAARLLYRREGLAPSYVQARFPAFYRILENKFYLDAVYQWVVDHVVLVCSRFVAMFDRKVVNDTAVDGTGRITRWSAMVLRYHETGIVSTYVMTVAISAMAIVLIVLTTK